jgi:DNA-binding transcriptional regulator YhcF (GntR family)
VFEIDPGSTVPPFEQLRRRIADQAADGSLPPGTRLPTVRRLAEDLGLAPGTVARAYRELETDGVIETRGRHGSFVRTPGAEHERLAAEAAKEFADRIRRIGVAPATALELARAALEG